MMKTNLKELTWAQLLEEKSHAEQVGTPWETYLLDINEELAARKAAANQPEPTFIEYLEKNLKTKVYPHNKKKKVITNYGAAAYQLIPTKLKTYTQRIEGALVDVVFDPITKELKHMSTNKRKDVNHYKQHAERDFSFLVDQYWNFDGLK